MPHFYTEYSANLAAEFDRQALFARVTEVLTADGVFPLGGVRCRAFKVDEYRIADGAGDYAYVHMTLKIGAGRDLATCKAAGDKLFAAITEFFAPLQEKRLLAISFTMQELDSVLNYKKNNIHRYLKSQQEERNA